MNILVVGCSKVGARLALDLSRHGHDVFVVDRDEMALEALPENFKGLTLAGIPIDMDVLKRAGVESCDAVAAVTEEDNINIMVCQLAKQIFGVKQVVALLDEPSRDIVFSQFGISTVCPTNLSVASTVEALTEQALTQHLVFGSSTMSFFTVPVPKELVGKRVGDIETDATELLVGVLQKDNRVVLNTSSRMFLSEKDKLIYAKVID